MAMGLSIFPTFCSLSMCSGLKEGQERYESKYDLDGNGEIAFEDFLIFVDSFGKVANRGTTNSFTHESTFDQLPADNFWSSESSYLENTLWYIGNYDFAKYSGYQELLETFDYHLPTGKGLTILQAESYHTPDYIGDVKHLFDYEDSDTHSEYVAGILSEINEYPILYTRYKTFSVNLDRFHTATTADLRRFFSSKLSGNNTYPKTSYDGISIEPAKLLNISNTNGGGSALLLRQFDKFVEENDMVACTSQSSLKAGNVTTSGMSYNSIVVDQYYGNSNNFNGPKLNDHGVPRYKPDLVARSGRSSATSYSAPTVCSAAVLLLERTEVDASVSNAYNSVVIKAILMAGATRFNYRISTEWRDVEEVRPADPEHRPLFFHGEWERTSDAFPTSYKYGAGALNVLAAYNILHSGEFDANGLQPVSTLGWDYADKLMVGDVNEYRVFIEKKSMFSAVLVWHRYIDDDFNSYLPDFEISVYDATEMRVAYSDNGTSNVELVEIELAPGSYRMEVQAKSDGGSVDGLSWGLAWITKETCPEPQNLNVNSLSDSWEITWDLGGVEPVEHRKYRLEVSEDEQFSTIEKEVFVDMNQYTYPAPTEMANEIFPSVHLPEGWRCRLLLPVPTPHGAVNTSPRSNATEIPVYV